MKLAVFGILLVLNLLLQPFGAEGGRIRRDDEEESVGWLEQLYNKIMGTSGAETVTENQDNSTTGSNITTTSTATTNLPSLRTSAQTTWATNPTTKPNISTTSFTTKNAADESAAILDVTSTPRPTPTTTTTPPVNPECSKPNDMATYCEMSDKFKQYMNYNTSADAMAAKLFSSEVVDLLIQQCKPGVWCLPDNYIQNFSASKDDIFASGSPICEPGLRECIDMMTYMRVGCPDMMRLSMFDDALTLICAMNSLSELTPECFGHTIATLHITLADKIRESPQQVNHDTESGEFCLGSYVGMTRKFMCTLENCPHHQQLFHDFQPWHWFMDDAPIIKSVCNLTTVCGDKEAEEETTIMTTAALFMETVTTLQQTSTEDNSVKPREEPVLFFQVLNDEYTRLLIGITTGTIIGVLLILLVVCVLFKRVRRRGRMVLNKEGYTKLPSEEVQ